MKLLLITFANSILKGLSTAIAAAKEQAVYLDSNIARQVVQQLQLGKTDKCDRPTAQLSARELEVLQLVVDGKTNLEIAEMLYLSLSTVKTNISKHYEQISRRRSLAGCSGGIASGFGLVNCTCYIMLDVARSRLGNEF